MKSAFHFTSKELGSFISFSYSDDIFSKYLLTCYFFHIFLTNL